MMFGGQTNEADSLAIIDYAYDHGINFFDTASSYEKGEGERILGKGLKGRREHVIVATKIAHAVGDGLNASGLSRRHIIATTDKSLQNLATDYIDMVYLHQPDNETEIEETLDTFTTLIRAGKIRYLGVSNFAAWQIASLLAICDKRGYVRPIISQSPYSLLFRDVERELLPCLKAHKMGMAVYNPIAAGLLSGKYKTKEILENTRFANKKLYFDRYWNDKNFAGVERLSAIADKYGIPLLELALRWCIHQNGVSLVISGVSKMDQFRQNIPIFEKPALGDEILAECNQVWDEMENKTFFYNR